MKNNILTFCTLLLMLCVGSVFAQNPTCQTLRWDVNGDDDVDVGDVISLANLINQNEQYASMPKLSEDKQLKILDIGNSFSEDANKYLNGLVNCSGVDASNLCVYELYWGGSAFYHWVQAYYNNSENAAINYKLTKVTGKMGLSFSYPLDTYCETDELIKAVLTEVAWDVIIIHQLSGACYNYDVWHTENSAYGDLDAFLDILYNKQPQARLDFMLVHAPSKLVGETSGTETTDELWAKILDSAKKIKEQDGISNIVPYGTAVQNLRKAKPNDDEELSRDGLHLAFGLARYAAACAYYQAEIAPFTGVDVIGNTYRPELTGWEKDEANSKRSKPIEVNDENARLAQIAAYMATCFWWKTVDPTQHIYLFE